MAIPDFQSIMLPLLKLAGDGKEHTLRQAIEALAHEFGLSAEERRQLLPSGRQPTFDNRVGWARTFMAKAGLLQSPRRARFQITDRGLAVLNGRPAAINIGFLQQFPEFVEFRSGARVRPGDKDGTGRGGEPTPEEEIEAAHRTISEALAGQLLDLVKKCSAQRFEHLVIDLLVKMGYGGARPEESKIVGGPGDEGIDGVINEDPLGLDVVYVQAKKWKDTVGRPEIQKFVGALQGQRARKGVFITTSDFSPSARSYASSIDTKVVLIDGKTLAQLMIDRNVAVSPVAVYEIKRPDLDYFEVE